MTELKPSIKLFVGYPFSGELKSVVRKKGGEIPFPLVQIDRLEYIGKYIDENPVDPAKIDDLAKEIEEIFIKHYPDIALHLPAIQIFPQVFIH